MMYGTYRDTHITKVIKIDPKHITVEHETGKCEQWNIEAPEDKTPLIPLEERKINSTLKTLQTRKKTIEQKMKVYEEALKQLYPIIGVKVYGG